MSRLMDDFQPLIIPSTLRRLIEGHKANIKCIDTLGPGSNFVISGSRSVAVFPCSLCSLISMIGRKRADNQ
jgi:hypothetical protein